MPNEINNDGERRREGKRKVREVKETGTKWREPEGTQEPVWGN